MIDKKHALKYGYQLRQLVEYRVLVNLLFAVNLVLSDMFSHGKINYCCQRSFLLIVHPFILPEVPNPAVWNRVYLMPACQCRLVSLSLRQRPITDQSPEHVHGSVYSCRIGGFLESMKDTAWREPAVIQARRVYHLSNKCTHMHHTRCCPSIQNVLPQSFPHVFSHRVFRDFYRRGGVPYQDVHTSAIPVSLYGGQAARSYQYGDEETLYYPGSYLKDQTFVLVISICFIQSKVKSQIPHITTAALRCETYLGIYGNGKRNLRNRSPLSFQSHQ